MNSLIILSILLASVGVSEAIKCYKCTGCEAPFDSKDLVTCPSDIGTCATGRSDTVASNQVVRDCGREGDASGCSSSFNFNRLKSKTCYCVGNGCNTAAEVGVSEAIQCYKCTGCEAPFDSKDLVTCPSEIGTCATSRSATVASNQVVRDCGREGDASGCSKLTYNGKGSETCYCIGHGCNTAILATATATATKISITSLVSALLTILVFA